MKMFARVMAFVLAGAGAFQALALPPVLPPLPGQRPGQEPPARATNARLTLEKTSHDFGVVWDTGPVRTSFKFTNTGTDTLKITNVKSSCGCTVPEVNPKEYAPGESGEIEVIFNPKNRAGINNRTVTVQTNDGSKRTHVLTVRADVEWIVRIEPRAVTFPSVQKGETPTEVVLVTGRTPDFDAEAEVVGDQSLFEIKKEGVELVDMKGDGKQRQVKFLVKVKDGAKVGRTRTELRINTNDERKKEVTATLMANIRGDLSANPPRLQVGVVKPGETWRREVRVISRSATPFEITGHEVTGTMPAEGLGVEVEPLPDGKGSAYLVTISGEGSGETARHVGRIMLKTNVADEPELSIPYYAWVRDPNQQAGTLDRPGVRGAAARPSAAGNR